ncbi:MAG: CocE/NonD family hydrolase [Rhodospirillales bacterium]|nr:CocE/NonD family hydrolase [Rhodospirillales bacterium]
MCAGKMEDILEIENVWIPMSDGCRIAARIWMPKTADTARVPAILEYIPYRKRDFMRARDEPIHRYFAMRGYASVRVDIRGSGDSEGLLHDEYTLQEHEDALEIITWIAGQDWCTGAVGMMGISWGGFNALQVAALKPPALKAIITLCSTDDRYADDAHYMGGCLLNENMQWGSILTLYGALPPDPEIVGAGWRDSWRGRIEALQAFPAVWMQHPWRDAYWKHGSVCEDFGAIECAVYAIGGWADGYSNAVSRLITNLDCPKKGLIGPWAHVFPHDGVPGPEIGFLQEAVRWWDHWLKDIETGIMDEPVYRVWMQESAAPQPYYETWPGRWVAEEAWPSPRIQWRQMHLNPGRLEAEAGHETELSFCSPQSTGLRGGEWCGFGAEGEMPSDQRPDDGGSLAFDSEPLPGGFEILGAPVLALELRADKPVALLAARLCDVAPDGSSLRVSYGLLNLTHRDGHEHPKPLEPGRWYKLRVQLNDVAHAFPAGHRLRLALSTSYWPIAWPAPEAAVVGIRTGASTLELPVRPPSAKDAELRPFGAPESAPAKGHKKLRHMVMRRTIETDLTSNETVFTLRGDGGELGGATLARIEAIDLDLGYTLLRRHRIGESDPLSAQTEFIQTATLQRGGWSVRIECRTRLTATLESFQFTGDLETFEGETPFARREWNLTIPRAFV